MWLNFLNASIYYASLPTRAAIYPKGPKIEKNQSRLKLSISIENSISLEIFNPGPSELPTKTRVLVGGSLEIFNLDWKFQSRRAILNFFNLWALRVQESPGPKSQKNLKKVSFLGSAKKSPKIPQKVQTCPKKSEKGTFWAFFGFLNHSRLHLAAPDFSIIGCPKPQKFAEMRIWHFSHKTSSDKLGGLWGELWWVVVHSKWSTKMPRNFRPIFRPFFALTAARLIKMFREGRTWAIAVRRGSYQSLFLLNSGHFPPPPPQKN